MLRVIYLGDAVMAAGWRLAGVSVRSPSAADADTALAEALSQASLVLVSAALLPQLNEDALRRAQAALTHLLLVMPDLIGDVPAPDLAARLRSQLGMEAAAP